MDTNEILKSTAYTAIDMIQYVPNAVVTKSILEKPRGNISIVSFDRGEGQEVKITPFDTFAHVLEGEAEFVIAGVSNHLQAGQSIVIPAHSPYLVRSDERFKMMVTVIKSGYQV